MRVSMMEQVGTHKWPTPELKECALMCDVSCAIRLRRRLRSLRLRSPNNRTHSGRGAFRGQLESGLPHMSRYTCRIIHHCSPVASGCGNTATLTQWEREFDSLCTWRLYCRRAHATLVWCTRLIAMPAAVDGSLRYCHHHRVSPNAHVRDDSRVATDPLNIGVAAYNSCRIQGGNLLRCIRSVVHVRPRPPLFVASTNAFCRSDLPICSSSALRLRLCIVVSCIL